MFKKNNNNSFSYSFIRTLETKARAERGGKTYDKKTFSKLCDEATKKYKKAVLNEFKNSFDFEVADEIVKTAIKISENCELIHAAPYCKTANEVHEEVITILLARESAQLALEELTKLFPKENFDGAVSMLQFIDYAIEDIYLPERTKKEVDEYVRKNKVDIKKMVWFDRPTINEIPIMLQCELDMIEVEKISEMVDKNPVPISDEVKKYLKGKKQALANKIKKHSK